VRLTHRRRDGFAPFAIEVAETTVTPAARLLRAVLLPQQHQRHGAPLLVDLAPIDRWTRRQPSDRLEPETGADRARRRRSLPAPAR
jgi:hypothetical protein